MRLLLSRVMASNSLLTLDATTLFYFNLSASRREKNQGEPTLDLIQEWSASIDPEPLGTDSFASKLPSLTHGPSRASRSALSGSVAIITEHENRFQIGGISDDDEMMDGPERKRAILSPPKGKQRLTSSVSGSLKLEYTY